MNQLTRLRAFAQSKTTSYVPSCYPLLPSQQPVDFLSWPWIKQKKLFNKYLVFDRDASVAKDIKVDYSPLLWSRPARSEALKFFCEENYLIRVTIFAKIGEPLRSGMILLPLDQLNVPIEFFEEEMIATLERGVTLHIQFGEGCGNEQPTQATNCVYDKIFGFNKKAWGEYCQILGTNTCRAYPGMTINIHPRYRVNFRDLVPDLLLHLAHIRFAGDVHFVEMMGNDFFRTLASAMSTNPQNPWKWHNLLFGLIEEAAFRAKTNFDSGYVFLCRAYTLAEIALVSSIYLNQQTSLHPAASPYVNGTLALCTKIFTLYAWATHVLVESNTTEGQYHPRTWHVLEKMYTSVCNARSWPGMSSRQLAGALFVSGLFYEHLAGYLATPGNIKIVENLKLFKHGTDIFAHRKQAAHSFFAAAKINPDKFGDIAMKRWETLYKKFGAGVPKEVFEVELVSMPTLAGGTWHGWKVMWDDWGIDKLAYLEVMRQKEVALISKSQVKRLREKLGLGNCRKEPAGLLRCLVGG